MGHALHPVFLNMRTLLYTLVLVFSSSSCEAQRQSMLFEKIWGVDSFMYTNAILYTDQQPNGDYVMIGGKSLGHWGDYVHYACRMDSTGNMLWEKTWGIPDSRCVFSKVIKCNDGTYMAVGTSGGVLGGISDMTASNIDADGNILFCNYFNFGYHDAAFDVIPTYDGNYVISGYNGPSPGTAHPAFIKIDKLGGEIWRQTQSTLTNYSPLTLSQTADSGFVVLGSTQIFFNTFYSKYDSLGVMQWIRYPFGLGDTIGNHPGALRTNVDGSFDAIYDLDYIPGPEQATALLVHYDAQGDRQWSKEYFEQLGSFTVSPKDSVFWCTVGSGQALATMNSSNEFEIKTDGADDRYLYGYSHTNDGGYIGYGRTSNIGSSDLFYIAKYTTDGRHEAQPFLSLISISPNPSSDGNITASFDVQTDENVQVRVISMDGKLAYYDEIFCPANSHTDLPIRLDIATGATGVYILEVKTSTEYRRERIIVGRRAQ